MGMALGPLDNIDFVVLQIDVKAPTANPVTTIPTALTTNEVWLQTGASSRFIDFSAQPMMSMNFFINGVKFNMQVVNFSVQQESVEIWRINNMTFRAHPFHIHGNHFFVLEKNGVAPPLNERGRKDVVIVPAMGGVSLITKYSDFSDTTMPYMYHCHTLSHEDDGMMGQFTVAPPSPLSFNASVTDVSCFGGIDGSIDLTANGGVPPYSFQWSNGDTSQNLSGLPAGTYRCTITDSYNSTIDVSILINEPSTPFDIGTINESSHPTDSLIKIYSVIEDSQSVYLWSVTNGQIFSGQGTHEVEVMWNTGQGEVWLIASDGPCADTAFLQTSISSDGIIDLREVKIFQNPSGGSFTLQLDVPGIREIQVRVMNMVGQRIYETAPETYSGIYSKSLMLKNQTSGIYFLEVNLGVHSIVHKLLLRN